MNLAVTALFAAFAVIPAPQEAQLDGKEVFSVTPQTPVVVEMPVTPGVRVALDRLYAALGYSLTEMDAAQGKTGLPAIYAGVWNHHPGFLKGSLKKRAKEAEKLGVEGYVLSVDRKAVVIAGAGPAGVWYGLEALRQIAAEHPEGWPGMEVRDWPACAVRGAHVTMPLTREELAAYAALRCNWILFESSDFYDLEGVKADTWRRVFEEARSLNIEPVPLVRTLRGAEELVARHPEAAEGYTITEEVVLPGDDWAGLSKRHLLPAAEGPVSVMVSGMRCQDRRDYVVEPGVIEAPFLDTGYRWMIRRVPGGVIPSGATVSVTYSYVPAHASSLCPSAEETRAILADILTKLHAVVQPRYVHIGLDGADRILADRRCRTLGENRAQLLASYVDLWVALAKEYAPGVRLMAERDYLGEVFAEGHARVGGNVVFIERYGAETAPSSAGLAAARLMRVEGNMAEVYGATAHLESGMLGGFVRAPGAGETSFRLGMEKLWSPWHPMELWGEGLNAFFGTDLWQPEYAACLEAVASYLDRRTLRGLAPDSADEAFRDLEKGLRDRVPGAEEELDRVAGLYRNLSGYLALEAEYTRKAGSATLRKVADLAREQAKLDPGLTPDRLDRIVSTVERQGLFVPSSILFGRQLLAYRPGMTGEAYEVVAAPEYKDLPGRAEAFYELPGIVGPICRVDYETVGASKVSVATAREDGPWEVLSEWKPTPSSEVRGPALLSPALPVRRLRVAAEREQGAAVLRELRLFVRREPTEITCPYIVRPPSVHTSVEAAFGIDAVPARGFLREDGSVFAEAPTEVRLCRSRSHLYVGIEAWEPRMHAMVAGFQDRDAPLWEQESVLVTVDWGTGSVFRFAVNPLGAQYDARDGDTAWDGAWDVSVEKGEQGWRAVLAIPFEIFGGPPKSGARWGMGFHRVRHNAVHEESGWAGRGDADALGVVFFK